MLVYVRVAVIFFLVYLLLTADLSVSNLIVAAIVSSAIAVIVKPKPETMPLTRLPRALLGIVRYTAFLAVDVVKCGITVAKIVLDPKLPIHPGIVGIKSGMKTELGTALSAHAITITPGEQVIEIGDDGTMYTHCLDAIASGNGAEAAQANRRRLLGQIFE